MVIKNLFYKALVSLLFVTASAWAAEPKVLYMKFIDHELNLPAMLKLQSEMEMSKNPKQLSSQPTATCFQANIDEYLLNKSSADKKVYGCIFSDQVTMNAALLRAGLFVHTDIGMASDEQLFNSKLMTAVGGHDFLGKELINFHNHVEISRESAPEHQKLKDIEYQFTKQVLHKIMYANKENFILFAIINTKKFKENLTHELLHAQYYNVPEIAPTLLYVWQTAVTKQDQQTIITALKNGGYDMDQQELLLREFYSYFIQYNAEEYLESIKVLEDMAPLVKEYAPAITKALEQQDIKIVDIKNITQG